jgi:hypothetical protein
MSWNNTVAALMLASLSGSCTHPVIATDACPSRQDAALHFVDVFDGSPEELATLIPDMAEEHSGYWQLEYIYDAGRFVTIRCKYADGQTTDVKLSNRIKKCDYNIDSKKTLTLHCK